MKKMLVFVVLLFSFYFAYSQIIIRGTVIDVVTGEPIYNASIYYNNTQTGTKSNEAGNFALYSPQAQQELVISCIGYETIKIANPVPTAKYKVKLTQQQNTLNEVVVGQKMKSKAKWNAMFFRLLMGKDSHSYGDSKILNPDVINYYYNGINKILTVTNTAPIEIQHPRLGYILKVDLIKFEYHLRTEFLVRENSVFYESKYKSSQKEAIQMSTNSFYYGSKRHFFSALANNRLNEEGFELFRYHSVSNLAKQKAIDRINELTLKKVLSGYEKGSIFISDLIKGADSIDYYQRLLAQKDYISRNLIKINSDSIADYGAKIGIAKISFTDTVMIKYNYKSNLHFKHTKQNTAEVYGQDFETLMIKINNLRVEVTTYGQLDTNNILLIGNMAERGLSQELPKDFDPSEPRFKVARGLLRNP